MLVYLGHHKCVSSWIWAILEEVCREAGLQHRLVVDPLTPANHGVLTDYVSQKIDRRQLGDYLRMARVDFASCITADMEQVRALGRFKGFHVVRDPRDIIVSAYFSHRNSHPTDNLPHLAEHRKHLQQISKEEGLFAEMEFSAQEIIDIGAWDYQMPGVLELRSEDLTADPYGGFIQIFEHLGLMSWDGAFGIKAKSLHFLRTALNRFSTRYEALSSLRQPILVTGELLLGRVYDHRFQKKAGGRSVGKEDVNSHYRKGLAGDWRNHFNAEHAAYFKQRFADVILKTGYEADHHWNTREEQREVAFSS